MDACVSTPAPREGDHAVWLEAGVCHGLARGSTARVEARQCLVGAAEGKNHMACFMYGQLSAATTCAGLGIDVHGCVCVHGGRSS